MDCFHFGHGQGHWYGGGESLRASWPLEKSQVNKSAFITGDEGQTEWGNAIKKYFVNSNGVILSIADSTPLFLSIDSDHGLCIEARFDDFAYFYHRYHLPREIFINHLGQKGVENVSKSGQTRTQRSEMDNIFLGQKWT